MLLDLCDKSPRRRAALSLDLTRAQTEQLVHLHRVSQ